MKEDLGASWVVIHDALVPVDALGCRLLLGVPAEDDWEVEGWPQTLVVVE
jgi:hypothetical protein